MPHQLPCRTHRKWRFAQLVFAAFVVWFPCASAGLAQETKHSFKFTAGYEREAELLDESGFLGYEFVQAPFAAAEYIAVVPNAIGGKLTYGGLIKRTAARGGLRPETDLRAQVSYQRNIGAQKGLWYRLTGTADRAYTGDTWRFQRERLDLRVQKRSSAKHTTAANLRVGYRNQNEALFEGYDQTEVLAALNHTWRPRGDRLAASVTLYGEVRNAERDQYSYTEAGVRLRLRVPVSDKVDLSARATYFNRSFKDNFSNSNPTRRNDDRYKISFDVDYRVTRKLTARFSVGWDDNHSNISERAFSGTEFGFGLTRTFN